MHSPRRLSGLALLSLASFVLGTSLHAADTAARWWKGNTHTHTLWSDGDDYPESVADWYKTNGWNFLMLSDHNTLQITNRWIDVEKSKGRRLALDKYHQRFGAQWVEQRDVEGRLQARLKPLNEFRPLFDEPGRFLLVLGEEISGRHLNAPVHVNAFNLREVIEPRTGDTVLEVLRANVNAVLEQRERTGQPMFPHLNHPNFQWGVTAEELMMVEGEQFFEVYNGHPSVHNEGDEIHAGCERIWDIVLTRRLAELKLPILYGLGTDDAHSYHKQSVTNSNAGRGWIMVRATHLTPEHIIRAMEAGDFYASSGVTLNDVRFDGKEINLTIAAEPGVEYTTQFIGTRQGYDPKNEPVLSANGTPLRVTHRYSDDIGKVLAEVKGAKASYTTKGDEIYVRARVTSTKLKTNPYREGEFESAWTQPVVPGDGARAGGR
jgi:hypothetical protein